MKTMAVAHRLLLTGLLAWMAVVAQAADLLSRQETVSMALAVKKWYSEASNILPDLPQSKVLDQSLKPIAMVDTVRKASVLIPDMVLPTDDKGACSYSPPPLPKFRCRREDCGSCIEPLKDTLFSLETLMSGICTGQLMLENNSKIYFAATKASVGALKPSAIASTVIDAAEKEAKKKLILAARSTRISYQMRIASVYNEMHRIAYRIAACHPDRAKGRRWWVESQKYLKGLYAYYGVIAPSSLFDAAVWNNKFWQE